MENIGAVENWATRLKKIWEKTKQTEMHTRQEIKEVK